MEKLNDLAALDKAITWIEQLPVPTAGAAKHGRALYLLREDLNKTSEAFRELEQRAEAAEAYAKSLNYIIGLRESDLMAAEAKLAELVPDEAMSDENNTYEWVDGWNACRATILHRNTGRKPE
ncbi:hypothetical protein IFU23_06630 [Pantoea agglomerans]|uniref:Uncharacterized protein n=1 Tax=Enterobacter agglomerans TaxID=549 RepID=A0ACC5PWV8_ENTAG|nr:hypothetical protein [Pantoea agglomerans]MBD8129182.1 hypothetical protein [Pantoea agglomerans]MBD8153771.1 hypothetical protein [Pantoea agglomerans]MBD8157782.1 hypothetical protein [Pantoea agglomerans]MBD8231620.1 hypothetical protein [Pantoea agglomerans]MBD8241686.1 hypothetical protein [Pantoea agglomerans]